MKCPTCSVDLLLSERQGIEIDYCPKCRGIWLDRGELDKIIERTSSLPADLGYHGKHGEGREDKHLGHDSHHGYKGHGKKSFFAELFD